MGFLRNDSNVHEKERKGGKLDSAVTIGRNNEWRYTVYRFFGRFLSWEICHYIALRYGQWCDNSCPCVIRAYIYMIPQSFIRIPTYMCMCFARNSTAMKSQANAIVVTGWSARNCARTILVETATPTQRSVSVTRVDALSALWINKPAGSVIFG